MRLDKPYTNKQYADLAAYCNKNNCHIEDKGDYLEAVENVAPVLTKEEIESIRRQLYVAEVDPITSHINRLRDEEQTEEIVAEIESLKAERSAKVAEIKENNPYPVEESEVIEDGLQREETEVVELYSMEI